MTGAGRAIRYAATMATAPSAEQRQRRDTTLRERAFRVLDGAWRTTGGYCWPNRRTYPHLWLWDSCFHAIAWAALGDERALREIDAVFRAQLPSGFLPHIRYADSNRADRRRGPLRGVSSFTQPPVFVRALDAIRQAGIPIPDHFFERAAQALDCLWRDRLRDGLLVIIHPWETGLDDSPRWDSWVGSHRWRRRRWTRFDRFLVTQTRYAEDGRGIDNACFLAAPASFNAIAADAAALLGTLLGDTAWRQRAEALAAALDEHAWDDDEQLWRDIPLRGGGDSSRIPTVDGLLPALCTRDRSRAAAALAQLSDPERFHAPFGPRYLPRTHPLYRPGQYWRGPAWPPLNYYLALAAVRNGYLHLSADLAERTRNAVLRARFAEYWNPETGRGLGARPQTWATIAVAFPGDP